jgi:hypothetical protein
MPRRAAFVSYSGEKFRLGPCDDVVGDGPGARRGQQAGTSRPDRNKRPSRSPIRLGASLNILDDPFLLLGRSSRLESAELVVGPLSGFVFFRRVESILP